MSDLTSTRSRTSRRDGRAAGGWQTQSAVRAQFLRLSLGPACSTAVLVGGLAAAWVQGRPGPVGKAVLVAVLAIGWAVIAVRARSRAIAKGADLAEYLEAAVREEQGRREQGEQAERDWVLWLGGVVAELRRNLLQATEQLRRGDRPFDPAPLDPAPAEEDVFAALERQVRGFAVEAHASLLEASSSQQVQVLVNIAHRLQSLVTRSLRGLDAIEGDVEDPDLFDRVLHVDHLVTRLRRHIESLAVVGGAGTRSAPKPVAMSTVLRLALSEIESYSRVKIIRPVDGVLRGPAVSDVIHLVAELLENATMFSGPETTVLVQAQFVALGLAVDIDDRGLRMQPEDLAKANHLLARPDQVTVHEQLRDGRIGLYVVALLARRHGIRVTLQSNMYGGTRATLLVPAALLDTEVALAPPAAASPVAAVPAARAAVVVEPHRLPVPSTDRSSTGAAPAAVPQPTGERPLLPRREKGAAHRAVLQAPVPAAAGEARPDLMSQFTRGVQRAGEARNATDQS